MDRLETCAEVIVEGRLQCEAPNLGHGPAIRVFKKSDAGLIPSACWTSFDQLSFTSRVRKTVAELVLSKPSH